MDKRLEAQKDKERLLATLKDTVADVIELLDALTDEGERSDMEFGQCLAYVQTLKIIWGNCAEEDREAIGLDFDITERYGI